MPDRLSKFQWINFSDKNSFNLILTALEFQRGKYMNIDKLNNETNKPLEYEEVQIKKIVGESKPKSDIDIVYPQFTNVTNDSLDMLNTYIKHDAIIQYNEFLKLAYPEILADITEEEDTWHSEMNNYIETSYSFEALTTELISFKTITHLYYSGAAHPNYLSVGQNYWMNPLSKISLQSLLDNSQHALNLLHKLCKKKLIAQALERDIIESEFDDTFLLEGTYTAEWETFDNFCINEHGISLIFVPYHITAYALGVFIVEISFTEILEMYPDAQSLKYICKAMQGKTGD